MTTSLRSTVGTPAAEHEAIAELARRTAMLGAIGYAATRIVGGSDWRAGIQELLERLGEAMQVSRVSLFETHRGPDGKLVQSCRWDWGEPGLSPISNDPRYQNMSLAGEDGEELEDWARRRQRGEVVHALLSETTGYTRQVFEEGVRRIALVSDEPDKHAARDLAPGVTVHHRSELDAVQRELRDGPLVLVLHHRQRVVEQHRDPLVRGRRGARCHALHDRKEQPFFLVHVAQQLLAHIVEYGRQSRHLRMVLGVPVCQPVQILANDGNVGANVVVMPRDKAVDETRNGKGGEVDRRIRLGGNRPQLGDQMIDVDVGAGAGLIQRLPALAPELDPGAAEHIRRSQIAGDDGPDERVAVDVRHREAAPPRGRD